MKFLIAFFVLVLTSSLFAFDIVKDKTAVSAVIVPKDASYADNFAKDEFIKYVKEISGVTLPVSEKLTDGNNILIGQAAAKLVSDFDFSSLKYDGFIIKTDKNNLILAGAGTGTSYAVYSLLEDCFGVKYILPEEDYIPKNENMKVGILDRKDEPYFMSRETNWAANNNVPFYDIKLKLNGFWNPVPENLGGHVVLTGFCHTFNSLMSSEKYGNDHPEWFAERNGKRFVDFTSQPCLTNEEMTQEFIKNVLETIKNNPTDRIISCTQNDNQNFCTCQKCAEMAGKYGQSGLMIWFINKVAKAVGEVYPEKFVETFAYQYTRPLPKGGIKPLDNVIVRLCSIECDFGHAFDYETNASFMTDLKGWAEISKNLFIWDYSPNYMNYLIPHPNFQVQQKNMQLLYENHAVAVFNEGDYENRNSFLGHYKRYIISKLLWDPYLDFEKESKDFFRAYYGSSWEDMYKLMKSLDRPFRKDAPYLPIYMTDNPYYTAKDWETGFKYLNKALKIAERTRYYDRVLFDYLCYQAGFVFADKDIQNTVKNKGLVKFTTEEFLKLINELAPKEGVASFRESRPFAESPYSYELAEKTKPYPEICKNLKDSEWDDIEDVKWFIYPDVAKYVQNINDPEASGGSALGFTPKYKNWYAEKRLSHLRFADCRSADVYITYKVIKGNGHKKCLAAGMYSERDRKDVFGEFLYSDDTPNGEYMTKKIGTIDMTDFDASQYLWIGGVEDETAAELVYVDRVFLVFNK